MDLVFPLNDVKYPMLSDFSSRNVTSVYHGTESLAHLAPKVWSIVPKDFITLPFSKFKKAIRSWKPDKCPCRLCKQYVKGLGFI